MKEGWTYKKLEEVCIKCSNIRWDAIDDNKSFPYIDLTSVDRTDLCIHNPQIINKDGAPSRAKQIIKEGDVIFATTRPTLRRLSLIEKEFDGAICSTGFCVLRTKESILPKMLYYALQADDFYGYIEPLQTGASYPAVTDGVVKNYTIPVPPLGEQRSIVARLDAAFAGIDALKANAERQLAEARALFNRALTEEMTPKEGWEGKKFKDLCSFVRGPFGGSLKKECFVSSGYAVYEQQNAIYNRFTFRYFIDEEKYNSMMRFSVEPGDLIMSCSGTIGKVAIVPNGAAKGIINQALLKLTPKDILDRYYLKYLMESSFFDDLTTQYSDGAAIKNIASVAILKDIVLPIPPLSEQHSIVARLDALSANVRKLEEVQRKTLAECDALKQAMLKEVFE